MVSNLHVNLSSETIASPDERMSSYDNLDALKLKRKIMISIVFAVIAALQLVTSDVHAVPGIQGACKTLNFTTAAVDLDRYAGAWYEVGHSKSFYWQFDCKCTTAEYYPIYKSGQAGVEGEAAELERIRVLNTCRRGSVDGAMFQREASGKPYESEDPRDKGRLVVNFFKGLPFANADYRIIHVEKDYSKAVVVSCSRVGGSLTWILSRYPNVDDAEFARLKAIPTDMGFDTSDLVRSDQEGCWSFMDDKSSMFPKPLAIYSGPVPDKCASLPVAVTSMQVEQLQARWHILYTQPDFVENLFSKNCLCNTVTLQKSATIEGGYKGTFRSTVACRSKSPTGPRYDFVRPVFEISNLTSSMGHYVQKLYQGLAEEHWQILGYGKDGDIISSPTALFDASRFEHMLLYTCLDAGLLGKTYCIHIVSKENSISTEAVEKYKKLADKLGIYKADTMRAVVHGDQCLYDDKPPAVESSVPGQFSVQSV